MSLRQFRKSVALGILLGAASLAAIPAQAAGPSFGFGFGFGNRHDEGWVPFCVEMTDYQIRRSVAEHGYDHVYLNVRMHHHIQVRASKGGWVYLLEVSTCTGDLLDIQRLRHT